MFCCREEFVPSIKLANMIKLLKVIAFIHLVIVVLDIFLFQTNLFFLFLFQLMVIIISTCSKRYGCFMIVLIIYFMYIYKIFERAIQGFLVGINDGSKAMSFCFRVFLSVFEVFCIFFTFQLYKQSKHEYRINKGIIQDDRVPIQVNENENENNDEYNNEYNNDNNDDEMNYNNEEANNENDNQDENQPFQEHDNADENAGNNNQ